MFYSFSLCYYYSYQIINSQKDEAIYGRLPSVNDTSNVRAQEIGESIETITQFY